MLTNEQLIDELYNFITNDYDLYRQRLEPIYKNLCKKHDKNIYDEEKSQYLFENVVREGRKKYVSMFGVKYNVNVNNFNPLIVKEIAELIRNKFEQNIDNYF
ncbi:hypothetical protein Klosneuvirus_3_4 [Klosneuvirus KNV1]|uniref:Uncharacterized protein n=1 Tax=Klosneuvirus KNV1 TaxID=1977640 RepID=A0A1V0SJH6_9VIRU|nr:hypothetical protein Klosneuvirus_3_4 [Klosneuvirus KNV1]